MIKTRVCSMDFELGFGSIGCFAEWGDIPKRLLAALLMIRYSDNLLLILNIFALSTTFSSLVCWRDLFLNFDRALDLERVKW